ncbi:MAG: type III-B CRISPR module RAMP protein Cmr6 [Tepidanaerobacteraceae bacterium]|jgi:CRISPR-associated protein Cmr6|nr:type III-B CRISPR module RAMP protein Cmr6 [Tepidanaerobacteraceae bacterium]
MLTREEKSYEFFNSHDTSRILYDSIKKIGIYEWNNRKRNNERKDWCYKSTKFLINPALIFGKFIPDTAGEDAKENKHKYLQLVIDEMEKLNEEIKKNGVNISDRLKQSIEGLKYLGYQTENIGLSISWRLIVGLGASHPQETSMTLHHVYGIPYVPGSAIKGVTRHWIVLSKFGNDEQQALKNEEFKKIFGTQEKQGEIIFFDAYPINEIKLKIDIMNPHYPEYYSGLQPPTDWQQPNPIYFLTVEKAKFDFYLASKNPKLLSETLTWLKEALIQYGIGAKTSIGYGFFEV